MKKFTLVLLVICSFIACKKDKESPQPQSQAQICSTQKMVAGEWYFDCNNGTGITNCTFVPWQIISYSVNGIEYPPQTSMSSLNLGTVASEILYSPTYSYTVTVTNTTVKWDWCEVKYKYHPNHTGSYNSHPVKKMYFNCQ